MSNINIPIDVAIDILARLPIKSLLRFRCVCKSWCTIISDPKFIHMHLNMRRTTANIDGYIIYYKLECSRNSRYKTIFSHCDGTFAERERLEFPFNCLSGMRFRIVGSCNGLLCLTDVHHDHFGRIIYLWNPFIGKFKALNVSSVAHHVCSNVILGFGFDRWNIDYKVVRVLYFRDPLPVVVEVYSLSTNSWRKIAALIPCVTWSNSAVSHAILNGTYHWMVTDKLGDGSKFIMSFDFGDEVFREIMLPNNLLDRDGLDVSVGVFRESLSLIVHPEEDEIWEFCYIWVMKEYGVVESWAKLFTIGPQDEIGRPLGFGWNGEVLFNGDDGKLVSYHPDIRRFEYIQRRSALDAVTFVESLVLIKEGSDVFGQEKRFRGVTYKGVCIFLKEE